jgi:hypothetical protein
LEWSEIKEEYYSGVSVVAIMHGERLTCSVTLADPPLVATDTQATLFPDPDEKTIPLSDLPAFGDSPKTMGPLQLDFDTSRLLSKVLAARMTEASLGELAQTAESAHLRCVSVGLLTDEIVLKKIAREDSDTSVRKAAEERLSELLLEN